MYSLTVGILIINNRKSVHQERSDDARGGLRSGVDRRILIILLRLLSQLEYT